MGFSRRVSFVLVFSSVVLVNSLPRKTLVTSVIPNENRRSSRLSSVLSDYWAARGFHEAPTDHLLESESQAKDLMMTGDEIEDFKGLLKIRIPRERLTPPAIRSMKKRIRRPRLRLTPATRKQDLEIMESVTLVDGGTQLADGTIQVRPSLTKSQRKHQEAYGNDQISPLSYHLQGDDYKFQREPQQQPRQPSIFNTYSTLPLAYQSQQQQPSLGKPSAFEKIPKSIHQMSLSQFQKQLFQSERPQQHQQSLYPPPTPTSAQLTPQPKEQQSIFVVPPVPPKPQLAPVQHQPLSQNLRQQQQSLHQNLQHPPPSHQNLQQQPLRQNLQQQQQLAYSAQLFKQQFQHPFSPQSSEPSPLAKFTASLISTASGAAAAASAAANALSQSELATAYLNFPPSPPAPSPSIASPTINTFSQSELASQYLHFPPSAPAPSQSISASAAAQYPVSVPNPRIPHQNIPADSSNQLLPQVLLPTTTLSPIPPTTLRPGVVADDEHAISQNQLIEPENLAKQLTMIYETGKKILYFPKGVVDTVDTFLKQMERNPMIAYWGDKFFAKVFGDTSGT